MALPIQSFWKLCIVLEGQYPSNMSCIGVVLALWYKEKNFCLIWRCSIEFYWVCFTIKKIWACLPEFDVNTQRYWTELFLFERKRNLKKNYFVKKHRVNFKINCLRIEFYRVIFKIQKLLLISVCKIKLFWVIMQFYKVKSFTRYHFVKKKILKLNNRKLRWIFTGWFSQGHLLQGGNFGQHELVKLHITHIHV